MNNHNNQQTTDARNSNYVRFILIRKPEQYLKCYKYVTIPEPAPTREASEAPGEQAVGSLIDQG